MLSKNEVLKSNFKLVGGVGARRVWDDSLNFKRISWYKETSLVFDILLAPISEQSPFYSWFSTTEQEQLRECKQAYIYLDYTLDSKFLSRTDVRDQLRQQGFRPVVVTNFVRELKNHPQYRRNNLSYYRVMGLCRVSSSSGMKVKLPGFALVEIL